MLTEVPLVRQPQGVCITMKPPGFLSVQPVGYLLARAAELRSMAVTARTITTAAALVRMAERFEDMAARRLDLPDNDGGA